MRSRDDRRGAEELDSISRRYDRDLRSVVTPSSIEDVNEYVLSPIASYLALPGKRMRPVLCEAGCLLAGGQREDVRNCALALESFHAAALIHDDIEDGARKRRGSTAFHVAEGIPLAINAGDYSLALALGLILRDCSLTDAVKVRVLDEFATMAERTAEGQAMDIGWSRDGRLDITVEECLFMMEGKTAWYSCAAPLAIGGIIAGADADLVDELHFIGRKAGLAFQMRDDLDNLLAAGDSKDKALDVSQGKRTVIVAHALIHSDEADELADILTSATEDAGQIERAVSIMEESGSLAYAEDLIGRYCADARFALDKAFSPGAGKDLLEEILVMIERD